MHSTSKNDKMLGKVSQLTLFINSSQTQQYMSIHTRSSMYSQKRILVKNVTVKYRHRCLHNVRFLKLLKLVAIQFLSQNGKKSLIAVGKSTSLP